MSGAVARSQGGPNVLPSFKDAMAALAGGVCLVTAVDEKAEPVGFAASSVTSVSLDPPLLLMCQAKSSRSHRVFSACSLFAVNVLGEQQRDLAVRFSTPGVDRFTGTGFALDSAGVPTHPSALARVRCRRTRTIDAGDHSIIIGEVVDVDVTGGRPLVHQDRRYQRIAPVPVAGGGA